MRTHPIPTKLILLFDINISVVADIGRAASVAHRSRLVGRGAQLFQRPDQPGRRGPRRSNRPGIIFNLSNI